MDPTYQLQPLSALWGQVKGKAKPLLWPDDRVIFGGTLEATIMFVDLCGFSTRCWELRDQPQSAAIVGHEGLKQTEEWCSGMPSLSRTFLDKVVGDALMLVIPGPRTQSITDALWIAHGAFFRPEFPCKAGACWGRVFLGDVGLLDAMGQPRVSALTVMGHVVNVACRLCSEAQPREICLLDQPLDGIPAPLDGVTVHKNELKHFRLAPRSVVLKGCGAAPLNIVRIYGAGLLGDPADPRDQTQLDVLMALCNVPDAPSLD